MTGETPMAERARAEFSDSHFSSRKGCLINRAADSYRLQIQFENRLCLVVNLSQFISIENEQFWAAIQAWAFCVHGPSQQFFSAAWTTKNARGAAAASSVRLVFTSF
jgi:hypothetical protein